MAHFLLGLVFLADACPAPPAVGLRRRAGHRAAEVPLVSRSSLLLARLQLAATVVVVTLGTVVTSTGPHGGDPHARRFGFSLHAVAQLHGTSVEILLALRWSPCGTWSGRRPRPVMRRAEIVLIAMVAQAAVGYTQYFNGDPVALVAVHVAGACVLVIAMLRFYLGLSTSRRRSSADARRQPPRLRSTPTS